MFKTDFIINLSEIFPSRSLSNLSKVFPQLKDLIKQQGDSNIVFPKIPMFINKFSFYQMILEKIKNYFELEEKFIISDSIEIILKDLESIVKNSNCKPLNKTYANIKIDLPLINRNISPSFKDYEYNSPAIKTNRTFSTKSNGKTKINVPRSAKLNNSFNLGDHLSGKVNYVYLNLDEDKKPKEKIVHFADIETDLETKRSRPFIKSGKKKSNLKKSNIKKEFNKTINFKSNDLNINRNKKKLFLKNKTEYTIRGKSNGIRTKENSVSKEKYQITDISYSKRQNNSLYESNLKELFNNIDDKDFNIFEFEDKVGKENTLALIGKYIFDYFNFGEIINQTKYINWCKKIAEGYNRDNPYHTDLHAADIAHTIFIYFKVGNINEMLKLNKSSICALFLSSICHDYKHPGLNNNYLIETNNLIALNYNDISVLENMHISEAFKLIHSNKNCDIFEIFEKEEYKKIRKQMISCVLSTDMSNHKNSLEFMKKSINEKSQISENNYQDYMNLIIHSADISNPTKKYEIYHKWAELVVEEFYQQGDKEKNLGFPCSCDRTKVSLCKSQLGFIDFVEMPFYGLFIKVFPKLNFLYDNLNNNRKQIQLLEDDEKNN